MPRYDCLYDEKRDLMAVVPDLSVNLAAAIEHGVILDTGTIVEHNDIEDCSSIVGRVRDCFDAFEAQRAIRAAAKSAAQAAKAESAVASPAASSAPADSQSTATQ